MTKRRLSLQRDPLSELVPDDLVRVSGGATNPSCVRLLCMDEATLVVPCYQSSDCSHPCA